MIYTVTFNPAIDYVIHMDKVVPGSVNRTESEEVFFGGKGINVSTVLNNLEVESTVLGFIAGFTGEAIEKHLKEIGIKTWLIALDRGISRINVKIKGGEETDINAQGPEISPEALGKLFYRIEHLEQDDILVLAGSIPSSLPDNIYEGIMKLIDGKGVRTVVDATGDLLVNVLKFKPFLIKPNNHELGEIFGVEITDRDDIIKYAQKLQERGARNVLVSRAGDGAILVAETGEVIEMGVPDGKVVNSVGAGDSMVAGFLTGYLRTGDYKEALRLGTACGSATAFSAGLAKADLINKLYNSI